VQALGDRNGSAALFLDIDQASATGGARRLWVIFDRAFGLYLPFGARSAPNATGAEARLTGRDGIAPVLMARKGPTDHTPRR